MAKSSEFDELIGTLVILGFMWWVWTAETPPGWAEFFFWLLIGVGVFWLVTKLLASGRIQRTLERWQERRWAETLRIDNVDQMNGHEFEQYVSSMLEQHGFSVEQHGGSGDYGADEIAARDGERFVVQAKHRRAGNKVGPRTVRATIGARPKHDCDRAMVVTNRFFTESAKEQAGQECVRVLVNRPTLADWIKD